MNASIIILNWNGWKDTIECLESVFRLTGPDFRVIVCDNASADDSLERIRAWAKGDLPAGCANPSLSRLVHPPIPKPLSFRELKRKEAEEQPPHEEDRLVLIENGANLGFAGGCNVGLRHALRDDSCNYFWLLNNDTVADPEALSAMVNEIREVPDIGLCGSLNISYFKPTQVQAQGGRPYCRWTGRVRVDLYELKQSPPPPVRMDCVQGASMLATRAFLTSVGLLEEAYFLYFEELDWAVRAKGKFALGYSPKSIIYHKEGQAIGSSGDRRRRSQLSDEYLSRNRVLFTKKFFPWALPTVLSSICAAAALRLLKGDPKRATMMLLYMLRGLAAKA